MPEFYGIEKKVKSILEESGNEVVWIENKNLFLDYKGTNSKLKFLRKIYFLIFAPRKRYIKRELDKIENARFDILFSINCHVICPYLFKKLKCVNPRLLSVAYLWDSFNMYNWSDELKHFDKVYTFDHADSENFQIEYKPNFYVQRVNGVNQEVKYDLCFAGKFTAYRLSVINEILRKTENKGIKCFIILWPAYKILFHNNLVYLTLKKIKFPGRWTKDYLLHYEANEMLLKENFISENKMNFEEYQGYFQSSNVILDLPYEKQTGYTHRIIEALANGKKVITSNSGIRNEKFYNPLQICVLDDLNPEVDCKWIREKLIFPVRDCFSKLELHEWLKSILDVTFA